MQLTVVTAYPGVATAGYTGVPNTQAQATVAAAAVSAGGSLTRVPKLQSRSVALVLLVIVPSSSTSPADNGNQISYSTVTPGNSKSVVILLYSALGIGAITADVAFVQ